jgi:hypothetical protein
LENKLVSYSGTYKQGVRAVFSQWNGIFVAENAGKVCPSFLAAYEVVADK